MAECAYIQCMAAQEAAYWEARRQGMNLTDKQIGDLLRAAVPHLAPVLAQRIDAAHAQYDTEENAHYNEGLERASEIVREVLVDA